MIKYVVLLVHSSVIVFLMPLTGCLPGSAKKKSKISCEAAVIRAQYDSEKVTTDWGDRKFLALLPNFTSNFL